MVINHPRGKEFGEKYLVSKIGIFSVLDHKFVGVKYPQNFGRGNQQGIWSGTLCSPTLQSLAC
jgi:hypothetical protein